ncbi:MAG: acyl carrier protein [Bacteroidetes bacterium]|nr:acyl carrier protein [Bacteroidota bacterium]
MATQSLQDFLVAWTSLHLNKGLPVDPSCTMATYGIDSIRAVLLAEDTLNMFGIEYPPYLFFEDLTIAQLAEEGLNLMEEV